MTSCFREEEDCLGVDGMVGGRLMVVILLRGGSFDLDPWLPENRLVGGRLLGGILLGGGSFDLNPWLPEDRLVGGRLMVGVL